VTEFARKYVDGVNWRERIESDPRILHGKPCIKGTRIPVAMILGYLAADYDPAGVMAQFPDITKADISACLDYARDLATFTVAT
jgi:uncharacterized protein (DUF433 family)